MTKIDKFCPDCRAILPINNFRLRANEKNYYEAYCKDCIREKNRVYSRNNPQFPKSKSKPHPVKNILKEKARDLLQYAVRHGKIKRQSCVECGALKAEGHHEDYRKPYDVIWLCKIHHGQRHWMPRTLKRKIEKYEAIALAEKQS